MHQIELEMQNEELRRAQQELQESRNRYADLFDFAPVGYFVLDQHFLIVEANLTGSRLLGLERRQAARPEIYPVHCSRIPGPPLPLPDDSH